MAKFSNAYRLNSLEKDQFIFEAIRRGRTYDCIGAALDISKQAVCKRVKKIYKEAKENFTLEVDEEITRESDRLDFALSRLWPEVEKGNIKAIREMVNIAKRRSDLLGLDAPKKFANADGDDLFSGFIEALDQVHNKDNHEKSE